jgi:hypothetical protein
VLPAEPSPQPGPEGIHPAVLFEEHDNDTHVVRSSVRTHTADEGYASWAGPTPGRVSRAGQAQVQHRALPLTGRGP